MDFKSCSLHSHGYDISLKLDLSFMDERSPAPATAAARPSSALARGVRITEVTGKINPEPTVADETDFLIEEFLSPRKLRALTGLENLEDVHFLEMKVDTSETSLGNFGALLPNLSQLKLNNSIIASIRDLGSSFSALRILWMARCGLQDVDGVSAMCSLKELYLAYNEVSDISPISMLDRLDTLDLEGNNIDDLAQIEFLSLCTSLRCLTIEGNPVCLTPHPAQAAAGYDYRYAVKKAVPSLQVLDDEALVFPSAGSEGGSSTPSMGSMSTASFSADWNFLLELEKEGTVLPPGSDFVVDPELSLPGAGISGAAVRPATGYRPGTAMRPTSAMKRIGTAARATTAARLATAVPGSAAAARGSSPGVDGSAALDDASALTQGGVVCGNPSRALRTRHGRHQPSLTEADHPAAARLKSMAQLKQVTAGGATAAVEHSEAEGDEGVDSLLNELKEWRVKHEEIHKKIEASRAPQVLKIDYEEPILEDDDDNGDDDEDDDVLCDRCNHAIAGEGPCRCRATDETFLPEEADSGFRSRSEVTATPDDVGDDLPSPASLADGITFPASVVAAASRTMAVTPPTPPEKQPRPGGRRHLAAATGSRDRKPAAHESNHADGTKDRVSGSISSGAARPSSGPVPTPVSYEKFRMEPDYDKSRPKFIDHDNPVVRVELRSPEKPVLDRSSKTAASASMSGTAAVMAAAAGPSRMRRQLPVAPGTAAALPPKPSMLK